MTGGHKYHFNPETLCFEPKKKKKGLRIAFMVVGFVIFFVVVSVGFSTLFVSHFDTPEMKSLRKENQQLLSQYNFLNSKLSQLETVLDELQVRDDNIYRVVLGKNPVPESVRNAGFGGDDKYANLESFSDAELVLCTSKKIDAISKQAYIQAKSYEEVLNIALKKEKELSSTPAIMPVATNDLDHISSGWGMRMHPVYKVKMFHWGMDFVAPTGTKVYATGDGTVEATENLGNGHGKHIIINHSFGYKTLYAHLSKYNVKPGDKIKRGQVIGFVGSTGTSVAPHLHYEVYKGGKNVDPKYYYFKDLSPDQFDQMVARSNNNGRSFD
jgi:murein DD-endopeptidase MepM/ murein hydrolase activator NlpD